MELIVDGKKVSLRKISTGYALSIDGRSYEVDAALARPGLYSLRIGGEQREVAVRPETGSDYWVSVGGNGRRVSVLDPLAAMAAATTGETDRRRRQRVTAYMPGRVASILVQEGAEVAAGAGIIVLEAMKMQNEILAEQGGVVTRIFVEPGQAVDGGDPLFEIE
jgi:biotin carboxyl carrier protein